MLIVQKLNKNVTQEDLVRGYFSFLAGLNKINLSNQELTLLTFIALEGTISTVPTREKFLTGSKISKAVMGNLISSLKKKGFLQKEDSKVKIYNKIRADFKKATGFKCELNGSTDKGSSQEA